MLGAQRHENVRHRDQGRVDQSLAQVLPPVTARMNERGERMTDGVLYFVNSTFLSRNLRYRLPQHEDVIDS